MMDRRKCARWLLLLTGLVFAIASVQSVFALHAASAMPMPLGMGMATGTNNPPCHQAPARSSHSNKPDCCTSDFACFNKCSSAVVAISVYGADYGLQRNEVVLQPMTWTDITPKPPIHPPSA